MKINILLSKKDNCVLRKSHCDEIGRAASIMHKTSSFLLSSLLSMLPAKSFTDAIYKLDQLTSLSNGRKNETLLMKWT